MSKKIQNKKTKYISRQPDSSGHIRYTDEENAIWHDLITRQIPLLPKRACKPWIEAMYEMNFPTERVPQLKEISGVLKEHTGWSVAPVPALIGFTEFFQLLANRQFPVATFIRTRRRLGWM